MTGDVEDGYGKVADAFARNFSERGELGAAVAAYRDGGKVVDLWGGYRDRARTEPWERDTLTTVFSTTKGMSAIAMAVAHSQGLIDHDERVAFYWPEFAQHGKDEVTLHQLLAHQAGLPVVDVPLDVREFADHDALGAILAAQRLHWIPGTRQGYHAQTLGWYETQILRRADPQGRSIGRFFADEVAAPLGLEFYIGVPDDVGDERLAHLVGGGRVAALFHLHEMPTRFLLALMNPRSLTGRAFSSPKGMESFEDMNKREVLRVEQPSVTGTGQVRSLASAYADMATGGQRLGLRPTTLTALEAAPIRPTETAIDQVLRFETAFSLGFMKPTPRLPFGSSSRAYGHNGLGGSFAFADPDTGIGYAYGMNRVGFAVPTDPRERSVREALYEAVN